MQLSSDVYEYDFCLSKFQAAGKEFELIYLQHGQWPDAKHRPLVETFLKYCADGFHPNDLNDGVIDGICKRWQATREIRELYLNPAVFVEFETFRERFLLSSKTKRHFLDCHSWPPPEPSYKETSDIKHEIQLRFPQGPLPNSLAISPRTIADVIKSNIDALRVFSSIVGYLWAKKGLWSVTNNHHQI